MSIIHNIPKKTPNNCLFVKVSFVINIPIKILNKIEHISNTACVLITPFMENNSDKIIEIKTKHNMPIAKYFGFYFCLSN